MDTIDIHAVESKLTDITVTPIPLSSRRDKRDRDRDMADHYQQQQWKQYEAATKAFNLPPQTQISPVITTTPIPNKNQKTHHNQSSSSAASAAAATIRKTQSPVLTDSSVSITNVQQQQSTASSNIPNGNISKYAQLLMVIEEMGKEIRPTYTGSRTSVERLKRGIVHARVLVRECLMETDKNGRN